MEVLLREVFNESRTCVRAAAKPRQREWFDPTKPPTGAKHRLVLSIYE
ncbi:MAG: hypothetical protein VX945_00180 [Verrucomicrobiota bacterium]|nr:hypothetical protein [Verrucomicrobiota bacterium]